jgi:hypothetical protein
MSNLSEGAIYRRSKTSPAVLWPIHRNSALPVLFAPVSNNNSLGISAEQ